MQSNNFLQVLVEIDRTDPSSQSISLLSRFIPGECIYTELESLFITENENKNWINSDIMIEFFKSCDICEDISPETTNETVSQSGLKYERIKRGYFDAAFNTDNAWKEVELWHFHYSINHSLNDKIKENIEWREVNEDLFAKLILGQSLGQSTVMQDIVDKFHANIHI
jgi:hypothetical protein